MDAWTSSSLRTLSVTRATMQASEPTLLVDPVMLADDDSDDYEYEYHDTETETFYLNLDLTSQRGPIRPPRRRQDPSSSSQSAQPTADNLSSSAVQPSVDEDDSALESTEADTLNLERAQILGLHTPNPVVSYQNQIFSCSWADQIGTELFFAHPELEPDPSSEIPTLRHGNHFDLIAANSVKLLSRKANLISSSGFAPAQQETSNATGLPRKPGPQTNQSRFLERLAGVKRAKGETDPVRTSFSVRREQNFTDRLRGWARTEGQLTEIQRLSDAALRGDENAIATLENLYARIIAGSADRYSTQP